MIAYCLTHLLLRPEAVDATEVFQRLVRESRLLHVSHQLQQPRGALACVVHALCRVVRERRDVVKHLRARGC